ncbi:MAG: hypothetical protein MUC29_03985 [Pyrinomonadaceae bacterium]|jgi:flavorubredoxin|nr:hypothetical protein [Pyrinomonadaceae bacterium]
MKFEFFKIFLFILTFSFGLFIYSTFSDEVSVVRNVKTIDRVIEKHCDKNHFDSIRSSPTPDKSLYFSTKEAEGYLFKKISNKENKLACPLEEEGQCIEIEEGELGTVVGKVPSYEFKDRFTLKVKWTIDGIDYFAFVGKGE